MPVRAGFRAGRAWVALTTLASALGCGCNGGPDGSPLVTENQELRSKVEQLQRDLVIRDDQIRDQGQVIQTLRDWGPDQSLDRLVHVSRIELERMTGGYDEDHDGVDQGVVVYLRPVDQDGDTIKAAGAVTVRLLDLAMPEGRQLVGRVDLDPDELRPLWYGRFLTSHYTIKVPWAGGATRAEHKAITVHVSFTELLTGSTSEAQRVVEVHGVGSGPPG